MSTEENDLVKLCDDGYLNGIIKMHEKDNSVLDSLCKRPGGYIPLFLYACESGQLEICKWMYEIDNDIIDTVSIGDNSSALIWSVNSNEFNIKLVKWLCDVAPHQVDLENKNKLTVFDVINKQISSLQERSKLFKLLNTTKRKYRESKENKLIQKIDKLIEVMENKKLIDAPSKSWFT